MLARAGRKRKDAKRYPSGGVRHETADEVREVAVHQRLKFAALRTLVNPLFGFPLGQLYLEKRMNAHEFDAGVKWGDLCYRMAKVSGLPLPFPKVAAYNQQYGKPLIPESEGKPAVVSAYNAAFEALGEAGYWARREVNRVCVLDAEPQSFDRLAMGLKALALHWGLDRRH